MNVSLNVQVQANWQDNYFFHRKSTGAAEREAIRLIMGENYFYSYAASQRLLHPSLKLFGRICSQWQF